MHGSQLQWLGALWNLPATVAHQGLAMQAAGVDGINAGGEAFLGPI